MLGKFKFNYKFNIIIYSMANTEKEKVDEVSATSENKIMKEFTTSNAMIAVIAVLVVMSGVQVFQTQQLLKAVLSGAVKASTQTQGSPIGLPSQVGGCG